MQQLETLLPAWLPPEGALAALAGVVFLILLFLSLRRPGVPPEIYREMAIQSERSHHLSQQIDRLMDQTGQRFAEVGTGVADALRKQAEGQTSLFQQQQKAVADSIAAQNERLNAALDTLNQRLNANVAEQAQRTLASVEELKQRLAVIDAAQQNIAALGQQVTSLSMVLDNKQARGAFGEVQLASLVQDILPAESYAFQHTLSNGTRCDCLVKLPNPPGPIAIDSKFPLEGFQALRTATDDAARKVAVQRFVVDIRKHVDDIARKYVIDGETADGAVMFVPSEAVYAELHVNHAALVSETHRKKVFIASPNTLAALLHTMRAVMRDVRMREEAAGIQKIVGLLLDDVARLGDRVGKLRQHFTQAEKDIDDIEKSSRSITGRGERILKIETDEAGITPPLPERPSPSA